MAAEWDAAVIQFDDAGQGDGRGVRNTAPAYILRGDISLATNSTNKLTMADHQFQTGDEIRLVGSNLPLDLVAGLDYFVIRTDDDIFQVALTHAEAIAGTVETFQDDGGSTQEVHHLPPHNHKLYVDHITIRSGATGGAILVHDALNGKILVDIPSMATNDAVWWDVKNFINGVYMSTLPATCKVYVWLGSPGGAGRSL